MVIKVYVSSCSGNIEIKRKQDFVVSVLEGRKIEYQEIDISDSAHEADKQFMRANAKPAGNDRVPLPPQIFSDDTYCGNYDSFHEANENDALNVFLGMAPAVVPHVTEKSTASINLHTASHAGDFEPNDPHATDNGAYPVDQGFHDEHNGEESFHQEQEQEEQDSYEVEAQ